MIAGWPYVKERETKIERKKRERSSGRTRDGEKGEEEGAKRQEVGCWSYAGESRGNGERDKRENEGEMERAKFLSDWATCPV